jgi:hypothetical protein
MPFSSSKPAAAKSFDASESDRITDGPVFPIFGEKLNVWRFDSLQMLALKMESDTVWQHVNRYLLARAHSDQLRFCRTKNVHLMKSTLSSGDRIK